jgi:hypothetical protein
MVSDCHVCVEEEEGVEGRLLLISGREVARRRRLESSTFGSTSARVRFVGRVVTRTNCV